MVDSYRVQSYERRQTAQTLDAIFSKVYFRVRLRFMTVRKIGDDMLNTFSQENETMLFAFVYLCSSFHLEGFL